MANPGGGEQPASECRVPRSSSKSTATAPVSNAQQSVTVGALLIRSRASATTTPRTTHKAGQTSNTSIQTKGVEDPPSFVSLFKYHASEPAKVAAAQTGSPDGKGLRRVGLDTVSIQQ
jgi:hypothetical protein